MAKEKSKKETSAVKQNISGHYVGGGIKGPELCVQKLALWWLFVIRALGLGTINVCRKRPSKTLKVITRGAGMGGTVGKRPPTLDILAVV